MYTIVYPFTKLHDRHISKVRVGVGPMEFQLCIMPDNRCRHKLELHGTNTDTNTDFKDAPIV